MANLLNGNTFYIDSTSPDLERKQALVVYIALTATASNAIMVLSDVGAAPQKKLELRVAGAGTTQLFRFTDSPVLFPNGISVTTLTNAVATLVIKNSGG